MPIRIPIAAVIQIDAAVVSVDPSRSDDAAAKMQDAAAVDYVEPNYALGSFRLPNDRSFGSQWGLMNTGQDGGQVGADIHAPVAWDLSTGGPVVVAVVDTGIALTHPELAGNVWVNPDDPANGQDDDGNKNKEPQCKYGNDQVGTVVRH